MNLESINAPAGVEDKSPLRGSRNYAR